VRFPAGTDVAAKLGVPTDKPLFATIWTTTPWTLPSNLAIALHPDLEYAVVDVPEGYHIVAKELLEEVSGKAEWTSPAVVATFKGTAIEHMKYRHAFLDREGLFVIGDYVTLE